MTTMNLNELTDKELTNVNGGSFWDAVQDFVNTFIPGRNNGGKKIIDEHNKQNSFPSPLDIPNIPPWEL